MQSSSQAGITRALVFAFLVAALASCTGKTPSEPVKGDDVVVIPPEKVPNGIFVSVGAGGDGKIDSPFGTIAEALEAADLTDGTDTIYISTGIYTERPEIVSSVLIYGGRDANNKWKESTSDSTVVAGGSSTTAASSKTGRTAIGAIVRDVVGPVWLHNMTIIAPDAQDSGESSIGLVCFNSDSVKISDCIIVAGSGANGAAGANGMDGSELNRETLSRGGTPVEGVAGAGPLPPGGQGFCADGSQTGGAGDSTGQGAKVGQIGNAGEVRLISTEEWIFISSDALLLPAVQDGLSGTDGTDGCGGGAGRDGGRYCQIDRHTGQTQCYFLDSGGKGGKGGKGGLGGFGGLSGGTSISLLVVHSQTDLHYSNLVAKGGGNGGQGGSGGIGETGQPGFPAFILMISSVPATPGAAGGNGGNGGHGSGGAGGWSVAIFSVNAHVHAPTEQNQLTVGAGGAGGLDGGRTIQSPNGQSKQFVTLTIQP